MAPDRSPWWRAIDAADAALAPKAERLTRSGHFLDALGLAWRAQAGVRRRLEARSRQALHLFNLPAASDVTRLRRQVAALDHEVRQISMALEHARSAASRTAEGRTSDGDEPAGVGEQRASRARRSSPAHPSRRRAQRPTGP